MNFIARMVEQYPDDLDEMVDAISQHVEENANQHERENDHQAQEHYDHETVDYEDGEVDFSRREMQTQLTTYLRNTLTREQLDDLGL